MNLESDELLIDFKQVNDQAREAVMKILALCQEHNACIVALAADSDQCLEALDSNDIGFTVITCTDSAPMTNWLTDEAVEYVQGLIGDWEIKHDPSAD